MNISHSKEEIEKILKEEDFEYHSVDLPFGLRTPGADRSDTIDLIFPKSFAGKTVLEIGSALGSVVFEAEKRGASRIVGTETNDKRFRQANILKDIKNSKIEFVN